MVKALAIRTLSISGLECSRLQLDKTMSELCSIALIVTGENLFPDHVTQALKIEPSKCWVKGTPLFISAKKCHDTNGWKYIRDATCADAASSILNSIAASLEAACEFNPLDFGDADSNSELVVTFFETPVTMFLVSPIVLRVLASWQISLTISVLSDHTNWSGGDS